MLSTTALATTDKLDVTFGSDEQDGLTDHHHHISHYPSYIEQHHHNMMNTTGDNISAGNSSEGGGKILAPIGLKKPSGASRNEAQNNMRQKRSSPVQEESVEEEPEIESVADTTEDYEKQR